MNSLKNSNLDLLGENNPFVLAMSQVNDDLSIFLKYPYLTSLQRDTISHHKDNLQQLVTTWSCGIGKCLNTYDCRAFKDLGDYISKEPFKNLFESTTIPDRLAELWTLIRQVPENKVFEVIMGQCINNFTPSSHVFKKTFDARSNTRIFIQMVLDRQNNKSNVDILCDIPALLLTILIRSEAHEFLIGEMLCRVEKEIGETVDIPNLLSIHGKVVKGSSFKPDTRALRDAIAHNHFKVNKTKEGDYIINFENYEMGWHFVKTFSRQDLLEFYLDFDTYYNFYRLLITLRLWEGFLMTNFVKPEDS